MEELLTVSGVVPEPVEVGDTASNAAGPGQPSELFTTTCGARFTAHSPKRVQVEANIAGHLMMNGNARVTNKRQNE